MTQAECLFLGTGGSSGIPVIGCHCSVCTSSDPLNKRLRPSALITCKGKTLLIDAGPDFRTQALHYQINRLDALLLTHSHFDHIAGLDELRIYYLQTQKPLPVLLSQSTYLELKTRYDYLFRKKNPSGSLTAQFEFHVLDNEPGIVSFLDLEIGYVHYEQAGMPVVGFRFGSLAYLSDIRHYPETIFDHLKDVKILILSALRERPSIMHFNIDEAIAFSQHTEAKTIYFTHMSHDLEHRSAQLKLPEGYYFAYDGLKIKYGF